MITLEQALARGGSDSFRAFARHVNPPEAKLFRLANADRRFVRAEGAHLYDEHGRRFLDLTGGFGALNLGHNPPEVLAAVKRAQSLPNVLLAAYSPLMGALAETLSDLLPKDAWIVSFGSGGAEAVELALKTVRAATGRARFVSCENAYHGLTFGAMSISGNRRYRDLFGSLVEHCETVPGEGAPSFRPEVFSRPSRQPVAPTARCSYSMRFRPVLGRTGRLFALEHENVEPDIVLLSKSLGAGVLPVSVCCAREDIWRRAFDTHDRFDTVISTFGGNAAACAAALKTIELTLAQDLPGRAAALGRHARQRLEALARRHDMVKSVRGQGLLLGIELEPPEFSKAAIGGNLASMVASCLLNDHGVVTLYFDLAPNVLRFEPPLIVTEAQIDEAIDALDRVLALGIGGLALSIGKSAIARLVHRG